MNYFPYSNGYSTTNKYYQEFKSAPNNSNNTLVWPWHMEDEYYLYQGLPQDKDISSRVTNEQIMEFFDGFII